MVNSGESTEKAGYDLYINIQMTGNEDIPLVLGSFTSDVGNIVFMHSVAWQWERRIARVICLVSIDRNSIINQRILYLLLECLMGYHVCEGRIKV